MPVSCGHKATSPGDVAEVPIRPGDIFDRDTDHPRPLVGCLRWSTCGT